MKIGKKFICLLAALALALSLCACQNGPDTPPAPDVPPSQDVTPPAGNTPPSDGQTLIDGNTNDPHTPPSGGQDSQDSQGSGQDGQGSGQENQDGQGSGQENQDGQGGGQGDSQDEKDPASMKEAALGLIDQPVSELYAAIGQPLSTDYAPSCLEVGGEDGELHYDGFTVYTVKSADGSERVYDVL